MNTADLRKALSPRGSKPIIRLYFNNPYFKHDFIEDCIKQIEIKCMVEDGLNPLEMIGAMAIFDTAGVEHDPSRDSNNDVP